jgi:hypothetical protein
MATNNIPYVGWSVAAQNFRRLVAERASDPISVLIVGEPGVGKRLMARVWQKLSRAGVKKCPIVDLDAEGPSLPSRCIAHTTRPPEHKRAAYQSNGRGSPVPHNAPWHLGHDRFAAIPPGECEAPPLPASLLSAFNLVLYMPPLRERMIDVLAVLHALAMQAASADRGQVSAVLIHRLLTHSRWEGNVAQLIGYLRARIAAVTVSLPAETPRPSVGQSGTAGKAGTSKRAVTPEADRVSPDWVLGDETFDRLDADNRPGGTRYGQTFLPCIGRPGGDMDRPEWICQDRAVPLSRLPIVAYSAFLEDLFNHPEPGEPAVPHLGRVNLWAGSPVDETKTSSQPDSGGEGSQSSDKVPEGSSQAESSGAGPRRLAKVGRSNSKTPKVAESSSKPKNWVLPPGATPTWSWGDLENRLTTASPQEFLDKYLYGLKPPEGEYEKLVAALTSHTAFGATFSSLQDGIGVTLHASYRELYDWFSSIELPTVPRKRPGRPKKEKITDAETTAYILVVKRRMAIFEAAEVMGRTPAELTQLLQDFQRKGGVPRQRTIRGKLEFKDESDQPRDKRR